MKYVEVVFDKCPNAGTKVYGFKAYETYENGDILVVDTSLGWQVATAVKMIEGADAENCPAYKSDVIAKIDASVYLERKETSERLKKLKKLIDKRVAELQTVAVYEMLSASDPELKEMIDEYTKLCAKYEVMKNG